MSEMVTRQEFREDIRGLHARLDIMNNERFDQFKELTEKLTPLILLSSVVLDLKKKMKTLKQGSGRSNSGGGASLAGPSRFLYWYRSL